MPATFNYNGLVLSDPKEIANSFNVYFASIGDKLASEIKTPTNNNINFTSYLKNTTKNRLKFTHITEKDTIKAIDNLENKNSSGHDGFSNKLLKLIGHVLCKPNVDQWYFFQMLLKQQKLFRYIKKEIQRF